MNKELFFILSILFFSNFSFSQEIFCSTKVLPARNLEGNLTKDSSLVNLHFTITSDETFDLKIPEELKGQVAEGSNVMYWIILNDKVMKQVKT